MIASDLFERSTAPKSRRRPSTKRAGSPLQLRCRANTGPVAPVDQSRSKSMNRHSNCCPQCPHRRPFACGTDRPSASVAEYPTLPCTPPPPDLLSGKVARSSTGAHSPDTGVYVCTRSDLRPVDPRSNDRPDRSSRHDRQNHLCTPRGHPDRRPNPRLS